MLRRVALVRTHVSEELSASFIMVTRIGALGTTLAVFLDVTPCGSCKNRHFGGTYRLHHLGNKNRRARNKVSSNFFVPRSVLRLLVTTIGIPSSPILVTLMMEAIRSSEISVLTRYTRRNIPEDDILHSHSRENFKSYIALTGWTL
jgi:hypothetical protein